MSLCTNTDTLIVAGTAGQVLTFEFATESTDVNVAVSVRFLPRGYLHTCFAPTADHRQLARWLRELRLERPRRNEEQRNVHSVGSRPHIVSATVSASRDLSSCALLRHSHVCSLSIIHCAPTLELALFRYAVGTAHGFTIFDYKLNRILAAKCTLDPNALGNTVPAPSSTGESTLIRGRSLKKSLRESFRRLRKGRTIKKATMLPASKRIDESNPLSQTNMHLEEVIRVPVERQVEFREFKPVDEQVASMVRCLYFAKTYLNSGKLR